MRSGGHLLVLDNHRRGASRWEVVAQRAGWRDGRAPPASHFRRILRGGMIFPKGANALPPSSPRTIPSHHACVTVVRAQQCCGARRRAPARARPAATRRSSRDARLPAAATCDAEHCARAAHRTHERFRRPHDSVALARVRDAQRVQILRRSAQSAGSGAHVCIDVLEQLEVVVSGLAEPGPQVRQLVRRKPPAVVSSAPQDKGRTMQRQRSGCRGGPASQRAHPHRTATVTEAARAGVAPCRRAARVRARPRGPAAPAGCAPQSPRSRRRARTAHVARRHRPPGPPCTPPSRPASAPAPLPRVRSLCGVPVRRAGGGAAAGVRAAWRCSSLTCACQPGCTAPALHFGERRTARHRRRLNVLAVAGRARAHAHAHTHGRQVVATARVNQARHSSASTHPSSADTTMPTGRRLRPPVHDVKHMSRSWHTWLSRPLGVVTAGIVIEQRPAPSMWYWLPLTSHRSTCWGATTAHISGPATQRRRTAVGLLRRVIWAAGDGNGGVLGPQVPQRRAQHRAARQCLRGGKVQRKRLVQRHKQLLERLRERPRRALALQVLGEHARQPERRRLRRRRRVRVVAVGHGRASAALGGKGGLLRDRQQLAKRAQERVVHHVLRAVTGRGSGRHQTIARGSTSNEKLSGRRTVRGDERKQAKGRTALQEAGRSPVEAAGREQGRLMNDSNKK